MADLEESHFRGSVAKDVVFADLEWDRNSSGRGLLRMEGLMERFRGPMVKHKILALKTSLEMALT